MSTLDMIEAAATRLKGHARETPLLTSPFLDEIAGRRVFDQTGMSATYWQFSSFRGAWSAISALDDAARQRGVIAFFIRQTMHKGWPTRRHSTASPLSLSCHRTPRN